MEMPYVHKTGGRGTLAKRIALDYQQRMFLSSLLRTYHLLKLENGSGDSDFVIDLIRTVEK